MRKGITILHGFPGFLNGQYLTSVACNPVKRILYFLFLFRPSLPSLPMPEEKKNKLLYNFFSLGIVQAITSLLQLIVIPYVISKIGVDGFGIVAVAQVVMFYLSAFTEYGFNQTATRDISINRDDQFSISKIFFRVIFSKIILCVLSFIVLLILVLIVPVFRQYSFLYITGFVFVAGQTVLINWFFLGMEKMQQMAFILLVARVIFVLLVFLFIKSKADDVLYLFFLGTGNFVMGIISIFLVVKKFNIQFIMPARREIVDEFQKGWQITATNLSNNICQYSNVFILRLFTNDLVTGYYSVAERIFLTLRQMLSVFSQAVYPQVCRLMESNRFTIVSYFRKVYFPFLVAIFSGCVVLFFLSPWIIYFFIGHESTDVVLLLRLFAIVLLIASLNIPATLLLLSADQRKSYFKIYAAAAVVNVLLNIILAYYFQSKGTAIAILITELFVMIALTKEVFSLNIVNRQQLYSRTR
ncbi:MAG: oligosaccharide flippase family protein [Bacteroidota bacterium]